MNNIEIVLSVITAVTAIAGVTVAVKTLIDTRNKSVDDFLKERESRRKPNIKSIK